jgi:RHS repeat-associated protein
LRFPGQQYDAATGVHYNYFRDYEPGTGRYVQSDPIGLRGGISTYGYALGNPLMYSDPSGLVSVCRAVSTTAGAIVGGGIGYTCGCIIGGVGGGLGGTLVAPGVGTVGGAVAGCGGAGGWGGAAGAAAGATAGNSLADSMCGDDEPDCNEHFTRCLSTSLADVVGGSFGSSRCSLCRDSCVQNGGSWPSQFHTGDRCDYWNFQ